MMEPVVNMQASRPVRALAAAMLLAVSAACGMNDPGPVLPDVPDGVYEFRGTIVAVDRPRRIVEIDHEAIPGVMPAMTMPYEVENVALLDGIAVGDRIRGTLRVDSRGFVVTALQKG
jgi:protein SCO1/2